MAGLKEQLEAAGYDTSGMDDNQILGQLDQAGYDTSGLKQSHEAHQAQVGDFLSNLNKLAPSNVLKSAGAAAANAPGLTQMAANMLPGGDPFQIMQGAQNVQQNPSQITQAASRGAQVMAGGELQPNEQTQGNIGAGAGAALEMTAPSLFGKELGAKTPFKAGYNDPALALPGALEKAGDALGKVKNEAINASPKLDVETLKGMSKDPETLAKYAIERLKNLGDSPINAMSDAELLAYNQALGQVQSKGGVWADTYKNARDAIQSLMQGQNPALFSKMGQFAQAAVSREGPSFKAPYMIGALDPAIGAAKAGFSALASAAGQRTLGAGAGLMARNPGKISALLDAYEKLSKKKGY